MLKLASRLESTHLQGEGVHFWWEAFPGMIETIKTYFLNIFSVIFYLFLFFSYQPLLHPVRLLGIYPAVEQPYHHHGYERRCERIQAH